MQPVSNGGRILKKRARRIPGLGLAGRHDAKTVGCHLHCWASHFFAGCKWATGEAENELKVPWAWAEDSHAACWVWDDWAGG